MNCNDLAHLLKSREALVERGAKYLKEKTIGQHVVEVIARNGKLSLEALMGSLQETMQSGPSGEKYKAKAALSFLRSLQES